MQINGLIVYRFMISLSSYYKQLISKNSDFSFQIRNELFSALVLNECFCDGNYILGIKDRIPDLVSDDYETGIEITQCDLEIDLELKYIVEALERANFEYTAFLDICKQYPIDLKAYDFYVLNGCVKAYGPKIEGKEPYYFLPIFKKNIEKKIELRTV